MFFRGVDLSERALEADNVDLEFLQKAYLVGANLQSADLMGTKLQSALLVDANLQSADLHGAKLQSAYLGHANLQGAYLRGANLQSAYLDRANLQSANLVGANLQSAYLMDANLQGAYLDRANLQSAILIGANLQSALLMDANLQSANLGRAIVEGIDWIKKLKVKKVKGYDKIAKKYFVDPTTEVKFCDVETKEERSYFEIKARDQSLYTRKDELKERSKQRYKRPKIGGTCPKERIYPRYFA